MPDSIGAEQYPSFEERAKAKAEREALHAEAVSSKDELIAAKDREVAAAGLGCDPAWLHKNKTCGISTTQAQNYLLHKLVTTQRKALEALWTMYNQLYDDDFTQSNYSEIYLKCDTLDQFITRITEAD